MRLWRALWLMGQLSALVHGFYHQHDHRHDIHAKLHGEYRREVPSSVASAHHISPTGLSPASNGDSDAAAAVARALKVLRVRNKERLEHVQYNKYEFSTPKKVKSADYASLPLDYSQEAVDQVENSESTLERRDSNLTPDYGYSIPSKLKEAARIVAESKPPSPSTGNHSAVAAQMRVKYGLGTKDTLAAPQTLRAYDGLSEYVFDTNSTNPTTNDHELKARGSSAWWMATMAQRGSSPFAPSGYKVRASVEIQ